MASGGTGKETATNTKGLRLQQTLSPRLAQPVEDATVIAVSLALL